jgi:hypothetical protein
VGRGLLAQQRPDGMLSDILIYDALVITSLALLALLSVLPFIIPDDQGSA